MIGRHRWAVTTIYAAAVVVAHLTPVPATGDLPGLDKWVHAALFGALAFMTYWSLRPGMRFLTSVAVGVAAAGLVELLQSPLPYRSGDVWDFAAGAVGVVLGAGLAAVALDRRPVGSRRELDT